MPIEIIVTPGASDANSYITLEDADDYFYLRSPISAAWYGADDDAKSRALITATRLIDQLMDWDGTIVSEVQALLWPRVYMYDSRGIEIPVDAIPVELTWATSEFAAVLLVTDTTADLMTDGISSLSVAGAVSITFRDSAPPKRIGLPSIVYDLIRRWGKSREAAGMSQLIRG